MGLMPPKDPMHGARMEPQLRADPVGTILRVHPQSEDGPLESLARAPGRAVRPAGSITEVRRSPAPAVHRPSADPALARRLAHPQVRGLGNDERAGPLTESHRLIQKKPLRLVVFGSAPRTLVGGLLFVTQVWGDLS